MNDILTSSPKISTNLVQKVQLVKKSKTIIFNEVSFTILTAEYVNCSFSFQRVFFFREGGRVSIAFVKLKTVICYLKCTGSKFLCFEHFALCFPEVLQSSGLRPCKLQYIGRPFWPHLHQSGNEIVVVFDIFRQF